MLEEEPARNLRGGGHLESHHQAKSTRLQAQAALVEGVLRQATGQALRLRVTEAADGPAAGGAPARPRRLTEESLKADRLRSFRSKDAALDTAADALDLEIVD